MFSALSTTVFVEMFDRSLPCGFVAENCLLSTKVSRRPRSTNETLDFALQFKWYKQRKKRNRYRRFDNKRKILSNILYIGPVQVVK